MTADEIHRAMQLNPDLVPMFTDAGDFAGWRGQHPSIDPPALDERPPGDQPLPLDRP